jgi:hypothetical protein
MTWNMARSSEKLRYDKYTLDYGEKTEKRGK